MERNKPKVSIFTLGCKVNKYESDFMAQELEKAGFEIIHPSSDTQIFIINTCTVTNEADRKSRQMVGKFRKLSPNAKIICSGCYAQTNPEVFRSVSDAVIGNTGKENIVETANEVLSGKTLFLPTKAYWLNKKLNQKLNKSFERTRAYVLIEEGCDRCCTYCKIYHARGTKINSKPPELVVEEISEFVAAGFKEVVLTGINTGKYSFNGTDLPDLLKQISLLPYDFRIRLSSLDPDFIDDRLIDAISSDKICHHVHLSVQSGSDNILMKMNRKYKSKDVLSAVERLRSIDPLFSITADFIVGFPGETNEENQLSGVMINSIETLKTHIFRFSPKSNTPAERMRDQIISSVKRERAVVLSNISIISSHIYRRKSLNIKREVIIEQKINNKIYSGHDEYYIRHFFKIKEEVTNFIGRKVEVIGIQVDDKSLDGMVSDFAGFL